MEVSDLLAKTLANENINVTKQKVQTAAFDIINRNLILPMWEGLDPVVETMLVEHEVGHALFTPDDYVTTVKALPAIGDVLNVIEDARIERLFKERYPGSRKDFVAAYKIMNANDFFGLSNKDINTLGLVDRINCYFKLGVLSGVKFSSKEQPFVQRAITAVSFDEVKRLSYDIMDFLKKEMEDAVNAMAKLEIESEPEDGEYGEGEHQSFFDEDLDDDEKEDKAALFLDSEKEEELKANNQYENQLLSKTMETFNARLGEIAGLGATPVYHEISEEYDDKTVVITYKEILAKMRERVEWAKEYDRPRVINFRKSVESSVSHLVNQFELKKAAQVYALRSIRKTGVLDTAKIASYKVKDDLFLRNVKYPEGKNHGMVMLLDWSGSMSYGGVIYHSLDQIIQLTLFCRQVGIPFSVLAFSDPQDRHAPRNGSLDGTITDNGAHNVNLLELLSSDMSLSDYNEMMGYLICRHIFRQYGMSSTPLAPALLYMRKYLPMFQKKHKVDKMNLTVFTDGENTSHVINFGKSYYSSSKTSDYVRDSVTKKNYFMGSEKLTSWEKRQNEMEFCYRILRERCNATVTTYMVANRNVTQAMTNCGVHDLDPSKMNETQRQYTKDGFTKITGYGRDAIYIVNSRILVNTDFTVGDISSDMTGAKIASALKKGSKKSLKGKVLIEKFVETIS